MYMYVHCTLYIVWVSIKWGLIFWRVGILFRTELEERGKGGIGALPPLGLLQPPPLKISIDICIYSTDILD